MKKACMDNTPVSDGLGNGFLAGNNTESDPDEVDDTNSPVSVESCLAHFIKPELLSGEHAWHCENCSKLVKEGRKRMRKNQQKTALIQRNKSSNVCSTSEILQVMSHSFPDSLAALGNGISDTDENLKKHDTRRTNELCQDLSQEEEIRCVPEAAHLSASGLAVCSIHSDGKSDDTNDNGPVGRPFGLSEEHESGEEEELDLKCVKVMRDATRRILISKIPPILTIHLKRFSQDAHGRLSKLEDHVSFKEYIDLGPYMDRRSTERDNCIYHLIGVVEHSGSMRGGHYVAYVRGGDRRKGRSEEETIRGRSVWYEVLGCEAYILFYEKVKL
ncbi:ubiquitin carboxyl-terminal hydrolase 2-like [Spinacia oleracea]|uniref:Ubiquitin carboxyl-terminal hydrolase 2-like n=1 Tax=Spinacia oleracea TaxID=3562 RepID=A0A9R0I0Y0_SPIOL|nr:ubiquitin carboxyl-terminal hydrolase 2-like [Spinacia oleracea]